MKNILKISILVVLILLLIPTIVSAETLSKEDIVGSWYGQYIGSSDDGVKDLDVNRYMNMTITECDNQGNFKGLASVTTVTGQGFDDQWIDYEMAGSISFETKDFFMQGTKTLGSNSNSNWSFAGFVGKLTYNDNGEMYVSGILNGFEHRTFYFGHVSEWAKQEITEANKNNLIPETMKNKDLSQPITRAEFAAVANQLYEKISGIKVIAPESTFVDIAGNVDEESIKKAHSLNITVGFSDTEFAPDMLITREQLATMLCRSIKKYKFPEWTFETDNQYLLDYSGVPKYDDDSFIEDYAKPSVYYMTKMGIINGISENIFAPKNINDEQVAMNYATATREQAIVLALRIFKNVNKF